MIPKKIHYCWFGRGPKPEFAERCIASWKKYCPDYEIIEWNEESFDVNTNDYVKEAYEEKKYAFVSDYVRLWAIYSYGGIYMDTDVEVLKPLDRFLVHHAFTGFESPTKAVTGIIGCEKGNEVMKELLSYYSNKHFRLSNNDLDLTTNTVIITIALTRHGIRLDNTYQELCVGGGIVIYPNVVFCPDRERLNDKSYRQDVYTIHYFNASWKSTKRKTRESTWWWRTIIIPIAKVSDRLEFYFGEPYIDFKKKLKRTFFKNWKD